MLSINKELLEMSGARFARCLAGSGMIARAIITANGAALAPHFRARVTRKLVLHVDSSRLP